MFPLKNTEAYIHANGYRSTLGKELAARDAEIGELGSEIQALTNYVGENNVKNILNLASFQRQTTDKGVTFTDNGDGTFTANGTSTGNAQTYWISIPSATYGEIFSGKILSGCPNVAGCSISLEQQDSPWTKYATDNGSGATIGNIPSTAGGLAIICRVASGTTVNNVVFKPMIRDASISDPTYQPYAKTNVELTDDTTYKTGSFTAGESGFFHSLTIKQFGKVVTINGYVQNISPVGNTPLVLGTVSGVDMPPLDLRATAAIASAAYEDPSQMAYLTLTTSGELKVRCENAATNVSTYFSVSYIV